VLPRHVLFSLVKQEAGPFWGRLLAEEGKHWWLKADWNRWIEEEDLDDEALDDTGFNMDDLVMGGDAGRDDDDDDDDEDDDEEVKDEIKGETAEIPNIAQTTGEETTHEKEPSSQ